MTARVIITATLTRPPTHKASAKGSSYLIVNLREGKGEDARFWTGFAFSEAVVAILEQMQAGEPVSVAGDFSAEVYTPEGKPPRVSLKVTVDGVLSAHRPPKKPTEEKASSGGSEGRLPTTERGGRDFADEIPF